jgi:ABC-2 type transport system permease protein
VVALVALPAVLIGAQLVNSGDGVSFSSAVVLVPSITALLVGTIVQMDLAYDHDALALHVHTGVRGADDRAGRLLGTGVIVVPVVLVLCALSCLLAGDGTLLPASIGAALGLCLAAAGAGAWIGVYLPGRAPAPEANPLGRGSSGGVQSMIALLAIIPVVVVFGGPAFGLAIAALWMPALGWASLASALVLGGVAIWLGIRLGGRALDRRWPEVLAAITSESS